MSIRSNKILNSVGITLLKGISHLPFRVIYALSDGLYVLIRCVFRYRQQVVRKNLRRSFPEKSEAEIRQIEKAFYHHLCDLMLEAIKGWSMDLKDYEKRITFRGLDKIGEHFDQGESVIVLAMHHNNWEWCSVVQHLIKHRLLMVYDPVRGNRQFEDFLISIREKFGGKAIPVNKAARTALQFHLNETPYVLWLAADQRPGEVNQLWTIFMNQEACFLPGPGKISVKTNQPVFFHHSRKLKRGHYEVEFSPLIERPAELSEQEILQAYVQKMEEDIRHQPAHYLWSHKRWKQQRPAGYKLFVPHSPSQTVTNQP